MSKKTICYCSLFLFLFLFVNKDASAQRRKRVKEEAPHLSIYDIDTLQHTIPRNRQIFHDRIDKEQRRADVSDGAIDGIIYYSEDTTYTGVLTKAILTDVNHMQVMIENLPADGRDAVTDNQTKIRYLTAVWEMLRKYNNNTKIDPFYYKKLVTNLRQVIIADHENRFPLFAAANVNMLTLENGQQFYEEHPEVRSYLYIQLGRQDPKMMIKHLSEFANDTFAVYIVADAAKLVPNEVFNYASSTNYPLRNAVRRSDDPLVKAIVLIADRSKSPLKAMPFLNDIYTGKKTIAEIDAITENQDLFFQNLVRLKIENNTLASDTYSDELAYRSLKYVREMDDLHESPDAVRFKCIEKFGPEALYYIMVYGQDEIYTSSFLGTYKRMQEIMKPLTGDKFLDSLHRDHFRTFLRMCAGYNTLSNFLGTMPEEKRTQLMSDFIAGLQNGKEDDLEDAVDVADAYGSIKDSTLAIFLKGEVKKNFELSFKEKRKKGLYIYSLLSMLFNSENAGTTDTAALNESKKLGLPPINEVTYKSLTGDTNVVYEQFFFFGDEDGKNSYGSFLGNFRDGKWKIVTEKYWSMITSVTGKHVVIYANLPVPEPKDEEAQDTLCKYLAAHNIHPTIMVHRGHSYHLPLTLDRLDRQARIVILGSCGGYHNLSVVLDHSPNAHIISSKQTGTMAVNEPIIKMINDDLLEGKDVNWIKIWGKLDEYFAHKADVREKFSDYVPPYKNLGAIFIKAYRHMLNTEEAGM